MILKVCCNLNYFIIVWFYYLWKDNSQSECPLQFVSCKCATSEGCARFPGGVLCHRKLTTQTCLSVTDLITGECSCKVRLQNHYAGTEHCVGGTEE